MLHAIRIPIAVLLLLFASLSLGCDAERRRSTVREIERGTETPAAPATPTLTVRAAPSPTIDPSDPLPRLIRFAPGQVVDVPSGVFYADPHTGAVDVWQIADDFNPVGFEVSPSGRYIAYGALVRQQATPPSWRLFDTRRGTLRDLPYGPPQFSPDEQWYALAGPGGIIVARTEDDDEEQTFPIARFREPLGFVPVIAWSPDSSALLVAFDEPPWTDPFEGRVLRLVPATGEATDVAGGVLPYPRWSPDGARFFVVGGRGDVLRALTSDGRLVWTVSLETLGVVLPVRPDKPPAVQLSLPWTSPDGRHTAVSLRGDFDVPLNRVYVLDTATGAVRFWVDGAYTCPLHAWTADSRWLLVNGMRGAEAGAFLVAADGSQLRFLAPYVADLSPVDAGIAALRGGDQGLASLEVLDVPAGDVRHRIRFAGDLGWDTNHDPIWLSDGRMVAHAPHPGHGGCGEGPPITEPMRIHIP